MRLKYFPVSVTRSIATGVHVVAKFRHFPLFSVFLHKEEMQEFRYTPMKCISIAWYFFFFTAIRKRRELAE